MVVRWGALSQKELWPLEAQGAKQKGEKQPNRRKLGPGDREAHPCSCKPQGEHLGECRGSGKRQGRQGIRGNETAGPQQHHDKEWGLREYLVANSLGREQRHQKPKRLEEQRPEQ